MRGLFFFICFAVGEMRRKMCSSFDVNTLKGGDA